MKSLPKKLVPAKPARPVAQPKPASVAARAVAKVEPPSAKVAAAKRPSAPVVAAKKAAHATKSPPTATAAPKTAPKKTTLPRIAAATVVPVVTAAPAAEKPGKKPKPPAKTMKVPAPITDFLLKRQLPDVRRIASAALLSEDARGISSPSQGGRHKDEPRHTEASVDASLIAASLGSDAQPKIEDNYDYTVLEELARSTWCPSPTRMVNTGCGGGEAAVYFARRGFNVVGIDSDRTAVGLARERAWLASVEIDFMVGDLFETPNLLPAESFGLAIDRGAFYRLVDDRERQRYLANVRRLLFQGGVFYFSAGFFPLPEGYTKPKSKKAAPKILLVREGGVVVNEVRQAGFELLHRVLRPTGDSGEYGELLLYLRK